MKLVGSCSRTIQTHRIVEIVIIIFRNAPSNHIVSALNIIQVTAGIKHFNLIDNKHVVAIDEDFNRIHTAEQGDRIKCRMKSIGYAMVLASKCEV
jgi:hypothetical protein